VGNLHPESIRVDLRDDRLSTKISRPFRSDRLSSHCKELHWGFETKRTRHGSYRIAEPEKALLDWIYLQRQEGLPVAFDELSLNVIDKKKLGQYALKYPNSVQQTLQEAWL